ncbi:Periplasmic hemin-binding protein [Candidatus Rhodobacter oscarellae]|uniref:Periplasmic hemin-binding protein n=1 Tax=Candidatus Rhodobacter oscarellae TaxID=1675527 RepID=A0A0J9E4Q7_9RHOB|nr:ABC transporter substrate-binding protein [Candidatus Rhodobacter lobularis]KMW57727.1 Periplasmic hemin-binding protein [Candidatus Rhodobacter lobularis]
MRGAFLAGLAALLVTPALAEGERIVSVGGSLTEIIYALGAGDRVIARDTTSSYPAEVADLPNVGYIRNVAAEGVLSVNPDMIIAEHDLGPKETVALLEAAEIPLIIIPESPTAQGLADKINAVGLALGEEEKAAAMAADAQARVEAAFEKATSHGQAPKRVMFILSLQNGRAFASGADTTADAMIKLAGGINALGSFTGYKPLNSEAISQAKPDAILMISRDNNHGASNEELFAVPGMTLTPAFDTGSVIRMDGLYLLGFGPRTPDAIEDLADALYGG